MKNFGTALLVFLLVGAGAAGAAQLQLRPSTEVVASQIKLGDLVSEIADGPSDLWTMVVGQSPLLGEQRTWNQEALARTIQVKFPTLDIQWKGSKECRVQRPARLLTLPEIKARILEDLVKVTNQEGKADLVDFANVEPFLVPVSKFESHLELPPNCATSPWISSTLRISAGGETLMTKSIRFRWSWLRTGWQATRQVPSGALLSHADFKPVEIDALQHTSNSLFIAQELPEDMILTRPLSPGRSLASLDFKPRILVKRGSPVRVLVNAGSVAISMQALALEDGSRGSVINVQNPTSRKRLTARVVDEGSLEYVQ